MPRNYMPILGPFGASVSDYDGGDDQRFEDTTRKTGTIRFRTVWSDTEYTWPGNLDSDDSEDEEDSVDGSVPDDSSERDWDDYDNPSEDDSDGEASPVAKKQKR